MAYDSQPVEIPIYGLNQVPPGRAGPSGRLLSAKNMQVRKFVAAQQTVGVNTPAQIQLDPRDGLLSYPAGARSIVDGSPATLSWNTPQLLDALGGQLVDIVGGSPRVQSGAGWTSYPNNTIVTRTLSQDVFHVSQKLVQVTDFSWLLGVLCTVWTENTASSAGPLTTTMVGFKAADGAWLVQPTALFASSSAGTRTIAKVVTDGAHFFVAYNDASVVHVNCYDTNGVLLGTNSIGLHAGIWDITPAVTTGGNAGTVLFAQAQTLGTNAGVFLTSLGFSGGSVTAHSFLDNTIQCAGPLGWLTNDTGNGLAYLGTGKAVSGPSYEVHAYEISALAQVHDFNSGVDYATVFLDSIAGFAVTGGGGATVVLSAGTLAQNNAASGPPADPQLRYMQSFSVDRSNAVVQLRKTQSLAQVSRAFAIDGNYYSVGYYQSGSGTAVTPTSHAVTIGGGEFMLGAELQPVTVAIGDNVQGSPIAASGGGFVAVTNGHGNTAIAAGDAVAIYTVVAGDLLNVPLGGGLPVGTNVLKWTFSGLAGAFGSSTLSLVGSSEPTANQTWQIFPANGSATHTIYTKLFSDNGTSANPATFTTTGNWSVLANAIYPISNLPVLITPTTASMYLGGSFVVTGASGTGNNGTFGTLRVWLSNSLDPNSPYWSTASPGPAIAVLLGAQTNSPSIGFGATISPLHPNTWAFAGLKIDSSYVGSSLVVSNDGPNPVNNGAFPITSLSGVNPVTGGHTTLASEFFAFPLPTVAVELGPTQVAYTFSLPTLFGLINYTYQNALVSVQGAKSVNNGVYQIQTINADGTFIATRTDGTTNQVNQQFTGSQTITIFFAANIDPIVQATWFLVPLTGQQPIAGRWEYGSAYADWRIEGDATLGPNLYPFALASPVVTSQGTAIALPFRAQNVTQQVPLVTTAGQVPFAEEITANTVGIKVFTLGTAPGQSFENTTSLTIPGPLPISFTQSGFFEAGIGLAMEPPFLVSQSVASSSATLGLQLGATYLIQAVAEFTDENGDLIEAIPSQPLTVTMSGTNNVAKYGGRLPFPLGTTGQPIANTFGPCTRNVTISLYRTAIVGGIPTTQKYKITNDLSPNQLAPVSSLNPSGFSFPNAFTWNYIDCNPDIGLTDNQDIYTDGELPRYAPPPFSRGIGNYLNRDWALAYDGSVWMSAEKINGQAVAWNPAWRWQFPVTDKPKTIGVLENSMFVFCERAIYQIPLGGASLPSPKGGGSLPTPVLTRWPNGSKNGFALSIPNLVVYDSTAGGVWAINESLNNLWLSLPVIDDLTGAVCGLALDANQKLYIQQVGSQLVLVYDHVPGVWGGVVLPTQPVLINALGGQLVYQDSAVVSAQTPGAPADIVNGVVYGIAPDITFASVSFASVRGLKMIWGLQALGQYIGPHRINIVISYPDDGYSDQVVPPFTPTPGVPYIIPFYLMNEEVTSFGLRIYADFVGVLNPGGSFSLELLAAEVGVEGRALAGLKDSAAAV